MVDAAARRAHALVGVLFGALVGEHERPVGAWHAEWETLSELLALAGGAVARTADTVAGLEVDEDAMAANLAGPGETLLAEAVGLALGVRRRGAGDRQRRGGGRRPAGRDLRGRVRRRAGGGADGGRQLGPRPDRGPAAARPTT